MAEDICTSAPTSCEIEDLPLPTVPAVQCGAWRRNPRRHDERPQPTRQGEA